MQYLLDTSAGKVNQRTGPLVLGQLLTPLTNYKNWGGVFAMDNGAFSGFRETAFLRMLKRNNRFQHLFVVAPDVVGDAAQTRRLWDSRPDEMRQWKNAFVLQNGVTSQNVPWDELDAVFVGGTDPWKDSPDVISLVKEAIQKGKLVHAGRVNSAERYLHFAEAGCHTCDGSGVSRGLENDRHLRRITSSLEGAAGKWNVVMRNWLALSQLVTPSGSLLMEMERQEKQEKCLMLENASSK